MTSIASKFKVLEKLAIDNSPGLLTAVGVIGVIGTAVLTHKAAVKADRKIGNINTARLTNHEELLSRKEKVKHTWKLYAPPVTTGCVTIAAIVASNRIGSKRAAALAAAYTISERSFAEYKDKVVERLGDNEATKIRDEIAQDRVNANPPHEGNIVILGDGDVLCTELYTGRYFRSSIENIKRAVNNVNYQINTHGSATLSDFYDQLGIDHTAQSDEVGWDVDKLMDVEFTGVIVEGQPCVAFNFVTHPARYRFPKD